MSLRLNLGCELHKRPREKGWINIDVRPSCKPDLVHDLLRPLPYKANTVNEILARDILEHMPHPKVLVVLKDWLRVLKPKGEIYIQTPDLAILAQKILNGDLKTWKDISFWVYGSQNVKENSHLSGFTKPTLKKLLTEIGFKVTKVENGGTNIMLWAVKA